MAEEKVRELESDSTNDGVRTIQLKSWRGFHHFMLQEGWERSGLIWRGQKRDWPLRPSLDRERLLLTNQGIHVSVYDRQLYEFKRALAGRRGVNPADLSGQPGLENEHDEWWALGQQNGLKTPLLDWTESPFAALFFAFVEDSVTETEEEAKRNEDSYRYVYALDPILLYMRDLDMGAQREKALEEDPEPEVVRQEGEPVRAFVLRQMARDARTKERLYVPKIRVIEPWTDENIRLLSQGGVFTQAPPGRDVEGFIREQFAENDRNPAMFKFKIRDAYQPHCMMFLNRMAINHRTLFPDIHGAAHHANMFIEWGEY